MSAQASSLPAEKGMLASVTFKCEWCGGDFTYKPGLIGSDLGIRISVDRIGERCVRHTGTLVDLRTSPADAPAEEARDA